MTYLLRWRLPWGSSWLQNNLTREQIAQRSLLMYATNIYDYLRDNDVALTVDIETFPHKVNFDSRSATPFMPDPACRPRMSIRLDATHATYLAMILPVGHEASFEVVQEEKTP